MSCSIVDVKAYFLGEMEAREKSQVESHLGACAECRQELEQLGVMRTALLALPEEEVPRRIAFVSDKVFEPRWWQTIWRSGPAMGFASAALLAGAILVHGLTRPPAPSRAAAPIVTPASIDTAQIDKRIDQEVTRRVNAALAEQKQQTEQLLQASEKRYEQRRQKDLVDFQQVMRYQNQQMSHWMVASNDVAASRSAQ
jgi:Putative zinc-finger